MPDSAIYYRLVNSGTTNNFANVVRVEFPPFVVDPEIRLDLEEPTEPKARDMLDGHVQIPQTSNM